MSARIASSRQETLYFDNRLAQARELARQIRMRAPAAPLADLAPMERSNPWVAVGVLLLIVLVFGGMIFFFRP